MVQVGDEKLYQTQRDILSGVGRLEDNIVDAAQTLHFGLPGTTTLEYTLTYDIMRKPFQSCNTVFE